VQGCNSANPVRPKCSICVEKAVKGLMTLHQRVTTLEEKIDEMDKSIKDLTSWVKTMNNVGKEEGKMEQRVERGQTRKNLCVNGVS
jgi:TolA-binding protein